MKKTVILQIALLCLMIFAIAILMSIATGSLLIMDTQAPLKVGIIGGAVGAIAAGFGLYELRDNVRTQSHENDIQEAQFMLQYNQSFIQDEKMAAVEHELEQWMESPNSGSLYINNSNRQQFVNYLVYLEGMSPLILRDIVHLEHIDDLMSYRYFLAVNNPVLQQDQLFQYPNYYRGCFKVYSIWKKHKEKNGLPILLDKYSLDLWDEFEYYASSTSIRKCISKDDLQQIARLIYYTDPYIYPTAFGNIRKAQNDISKLIGEHGMFKMENIYVAFTEGHISGIAVVIDDKRDAFIPKLQDIYAKKSFRDVNEQYFNNIKSLVQDGSVYIACISVDKKMRDKGIGNLLLNRIINDRKSSRIVLEVLSSNAPGIHLYEKNGFKIICEKEGYSYKQPKPHCLLMERSC